MLLLSQSRDNVTVAARPEQWEETVTERNGGPVGQGWRLREALTDKVYQTHTQDTQQPPLLEALRRKYVNLLVFILIHESEN